MIPTAISETAATVAERINLESRDLIAEAEKGYPADAGRHAQFNAGLGIASMIRCYPC